jgi:Bifunctional DNA primase/polymerase, N-terminal
MSVVSETIPHGKCRADALCDYVSRGWSVFPVPPGTKKSYKSAERSGGRAWGMTRDPDEICRDFTRWPDAGIGIPTGAVNGLVVVETDTVVGGHATDGEPSLRELEAKYGALPETLQAISPSGSIHRYFKHPAGGIKIKCSSSEIGPGIDVKGDGGMVLAPPTVRSGVGEYRGLNNNPIAPMPDWLIELTGKQPPKRLTIRERATAAVNAHRVMRMVRSGGAGAYAAAALTDEINSLAGAGAGSRNDALNKSAFSLFQLVHAGLLKANDVERQLIEACTANGLMDDSGNGGLSRIMVTIRSAFNAAAVKPRRGLA